MTQASLPNYQTCTEILSKNNIAVSVAELHGLLSGILCAELQPQSNWLALIYDYTSEGVAWQGEAKGMAETLFTQTASELNSELLNFTLLQPDENAALIVQAEALSDWVGGFLAGFGIAGSSKANSPDSKEILQDLAQIAQLGVDEDEDELEEQLQLLDEVREHVRVCILNLYADNLLSIKNSPLSS